MHVKTIEQIEALLNRRASIPDICDCAECKARQDELAPLFRCMRCGYRGAPATLIYTHDEMKGEDALACPMCGCVGDDDEGGAWEIIRDLRALLRDPS